MSYKREDLSPSKEAIYGFTNTVALVAGVINFKTSIGSKGGRVSRTCQFVVVEVESAFNGILGWPFIYDIKVVPFSYHQCMRYPANDTIATVKEQQSKSWLSYKKMMKIPHKDNLFVWITPEVIPRENFPR